MSDQSADALAVPAEVQWSPPPANAPEDDLVAWANALPMSGDLNIRCRSLILEEGLFTVSEAPLTPNPNGAVNGGLLSAIADQCLGVVSVVNAPRNLMSVTGSLHGQFHRPAFAPLEIRARLINAGSRLIFVELQVDDCRGRRCATFQATMVVGGSERRG
jgi:uncharacterized protein (TIGR00369 family)